MALMGLEKVFDRVGRDALWKVLHIYGVWEESWEKQ